MDSAGPMMEQLVEQVKKVATHCTTEVAVVQVELGGICDKISASTELLEVSHEICVRCLLGTSPLR